MHTLTHKPLGRRAVYVYVCEGGLHEHRTRAAAVRCECRRGERYAKHSPECRKAYRDGR